MLVVYDSMTGNVGRFTSKLDKKCVRIREGLVIDEPFTLVTYTFGFGQPPGSVINFLQSNQTNLIAVAASGNRNWGERFARSADIISKKYDVPVLLKFELSGTNQDVKCFNERVEKIATH